MSEINPKPHKILTSLEWWNTLEVKYDDQKLLFSCIINIYIVTGLSTFPRWGRNIHYNDVITSTFRLFTKPFIQGADQRKHQISVSLAFVQGIHWWLVNSLHKGLVTQKIFAFDDVIISQTQSISCLLLPKLFEYNNDITWMSWHLKSLATWLFVQQLFSSQWQRKSKLLMRSWDV